MASWEAAAHSHPLSTLICKAKVPSSAGCGSQSGAPVQGGQDDPELLAALPGGAFPGTTETPWL